MMKKFASLAWITLLFCSASAYAELNIVVLDSVRAILESDEAQVLAEAANKEMEAEQTELTNRLQTDGEVMSATEQRNIQKQIEDIQIELEFGSKKLQKQVQDKRQEILQALAPKFDKVLKDIIQVDQIDFILAPDSLQYANSKHDITRRVTEQLNEEKD